MVAMVMMRMIMRRVVNNHQWCWWVRMLMVAMVRVMMAILPFAVSSSLSLSISLLAIFCCKNVESITIEGH